MAAVPARIVPICIGLALCLLAAEPRRKAPKSFGHNEIVVARNEALKAQIRECWNATPKVRRENLDIHVIVALRPDGTVREANVLGPASFMNDPWRRSLAESARRALVGSACNPLAVPAEWRARDQRITLTINPAAIF